MVIANKVVDKVEVGKTILSGYWYSVPSIWNIPLFSSDHT